MIVIIGPSVIPAIPASADRSEGCNYIEYAENAEMNIIKKVIQVYVYIYIYVYNAYPTHVFSNYASVLHMPTHFLGPGARIFDISGIRFSVPSGIPIIFN